MRLLLTCALAATLVFAQSDRGTITGTVSDATGALIPNAEIILTNTNTGSRSSTVTTGTGNYTVLALPAGTYTLAIEQAGFSKYQQTNIQVQVAVTTRVDVVLKVGTSAESVAVTAESTLLKTESAEQSTTITGKQINELPLNFGIGAGAIRNPLSFAQLTPGATFNGWNNISINGGNSNFKIIFEGQESDSAFQTRVSDEEQPSVEAIEQFTLQTSNFSAEYGRVGNGGIYNFTSKSGTNQFHGSVYDYFQNTALNAGIPFTNNGQGKHAKVVKHLSDGGGSIGGPVWIPKIYNGRNKTFFFFNIEKYRDRENLYAGVSTVPNAAYTSGDLSNNLAITANRNLGTDFAGRPIIQNAIYDPATATIDSSGRRVLQVFPNNIIPQNRIDPAAAKIIATLPKPNLGNGFVNNFTQSGAFFKLQQIPSLKVDHIFSDRVKISGYYGTQSTDKSNGVDGLPDALSRVRLQYITSKTARFNYDHTLSPRLLLHFGAGWMRHVNPDTVPSVSYDYDNKSLGIIGAPGLGYPRINSIGDSVLGGLAIPIGSGNRVLSIDQKPTATASMSYIRGNHTIKTGFDWKIDTQTSANTNGLAPAYGFSAAQTAQPLYGQALPNGTGTGSAWASFLLGLYDNVSAGNAVAPQYRRTSIAIYLQDTWKVNRKLTFDYGLRWDRQTPIREIHDRIASFSPTTPNPNANGLPGAVIYDGFGPGRCNCHLADAYNLALAPRLGMAYQLNPKTVIRAGWGLSFGSLAATGSQPSTSGLGFNTITVPSSGNGLAAGVLSQPLNLDQNALYNASYDPGLFVVPGVGVQASPGLYDRNTGRPPRVNQWNISLQREIFKDLVVEVAYLGNRSVWVNAGGGGSNTSASIPALINYNAVDPAVLRRYGLGDLTDANTRSLLSASITSPAAVAAGFKKPYAGFPDAGTVLQSLRPFPQFSSIPQFQAPVGKSWYDAFQMKVTKRYSKGLTATMAYAFSKALDNSTNAGNLYDRDSFKGLSATDLAHVLSLSVQYTVPTGALRRNKWSRAFLSDWQVSTIDTWQSAPLLASPASNNGIANYVATGYTRQVRVAGQPLYLKSPNCGCIDPTQETILNPAAWQDQAPGVPGSNIVYYRDFRGQRRPIVSGGLSKQFIIKERMAFSIRAEFFNLFNQNLSVGDPTTSSPATPPTRSNGLLTGGFGFLNYLNITSNSVNSSLPTPRTGQLVARFQF